MRLAVLITYYNEGALLRECLESVLSQPGSPDEIIVYDDASTNPPEAQIPAGARVRVIRAVENRGPGYGRNVLLRETDCDYVHFHDSDDLFHAGWCREIRAAIAEGAPEIVLTEVTSRRGALLVSEEVLNLASLREGDDLVRFCMRGSILPASATFSRALALSVGGYLTREILPQSEDFEFHVRMAAAARKWRTIPRPLITQRLRAGSHSADSVVVWTSAVKAIEILSRELPAKYRIDTADAAARIGSQLYAMKAMREARTAFQLARRLGPSRFLHRPRGYRILARLVGAEAAEWVALVYRRAIPERVRRRSQAV